MPDLVQRIRKNLESHRLVPPTGRLVVGVSGGLDSMVLLAVLRTLSDQDGQQLTVAHANHQLRGEESDADAVFVTAAAIQANLPIRVGRLPVREALQRSQESLEMVARRLRHRFLATTARELKIDTVALAHHADDQAELVLLRLLRGAGGEGLSGMDWSNVSPADPKIRLIRPLLDISRNELVAFAEARGISFRQDSSNADRTILRNRIRHELQPLLEREYNPALRTALLRTAQVVGADADFAARAAERWLKSARRTRFEQLHVAVQRSVIRQQLWELGHSADFDRVEQLRIQSSQISANDSLQLRRSAEGTLESNARPVPLKHRSYERKVSLHQTRKAIRFGTRMIHWCFTRPKLIRLGSQDCQEQFDAQSISETVILRHWRPGDRFQPLGFPRPAKVQNLLVNRKIDAAQRRELLVATDRKGEVFWIEGLPPGECFKVTPRSKQILVWTWKPADASSYKTAESARLTGS